MLAARLLRRLIRQGRLTVIDAEGCTHVFEGAEPGPSVRIRFRSRSLNWRMFLNPMMVTGEAIMEGELVVEDGEIYDFIDLVARNMRWGQPDHWLQTVLAGLRHIGRRIAQYNPADRSKRNVAHHYDLSGELYRLFLDADQQYSCAYYRGEDDDLETAQLNKKRHLTNKLLLRRGQRVLDIGSGWGGLGLHLARHGDVEVTGVTLSEEQHRVSNQRAQTAGLEERVRFDLVDYRNLTGQFDRIVSVGMFEHVGLGHYGEYFAKLRSLLTDDGVAVLHTIGRADGPGATHPWIRKYIFPGGYSPALSEIIPFIERNGLYVTDVEVLKLHYARTLRHWRERFQKNREQVRKLYDDRFCRMWELYLAGSECAFRYGGHVVFQIQMAKQIDAVPDTRDYLYRGGPRSTISRPQTVEEADSRAA